MRDVAVGAAGAALAASGAPFAAAAGKVLGEITLDALLVTYFGAPYGDDMTATYTFGRAFGTTFRLSSAEAPHFPIRASVPEGKRAGVAGLSMTQAESGRVRGALAIAPRSDFQLSGATIAPPQSPEKTGFQGILRPTLQIVGRPDRPGFRFAADGPRGASNFTTSAADLRAPETIGLGTSTAESWLAQYTPDVSALAEPRYDDLTVLSGGVGYEVEARSNELSDERVSATVKAAIVSSTFASGDLAGVFGVGKTLDVEYSAVQEGRPGKIMSFALAQTSVGGSASQVVYFDRVFKTFLLARPA